VTVRRNDPVVSPLSRGDVRAPMGGEAVYRRARSAGDAAEEWPDHLAKSELLIPDDEGSEPQAGTGPPSPGARAEAFDAWVDRQLQTLYGPVLNERMPDRLRALMDQVARRLDGTTPAPANEDDTKDHDHQ